MSALAAIAEDTRDIARVLLFTSPQPSLSLSLSVEDESLCLCGVKVVTTLKVLVPDPLLKVQYRNEP